MTDASSCWRRNVEAAADGHLYGPTGAAVMLGVKPTTLASKMKRLGIKRNS